eukprot:UN27123
MSNYFSILHKCRIISQFYTNAKFEIQSQFLNNHRIERISKQIFPILNID